METLGQIGVGLVAGGGLVTGFVILTEAIENAISVVQALRKAILSLQGASVLGALATLVTNPVFLAVAGVAATAGVAVISARALGQSQDNAANAAAQLRLQAATTGTTNPEQIRLNLLAQRNAAVLDAQALGAGPNRSAQVAKEFNDALELLKPALAAYEEAQKEAAIAAAALAERIQVSLDSLAIEAFNLNRTPREVRTGPRGAAGERPDFGKPGPFAEAIPRLEEARTFADDLGGELLQRAIQATNQWASLTVEAVGQVAGAFGDTLGRAILEPTKVLPALGEAFKQVFAGIVSTILTAVAKLVLFKVVLSSLGFGGVASEFSLTKALGFQQGGIVPGFQSGGLVSGGISGRDSVLIAAEPGEAVLPRTLVDRLLTNPSSGLGSPTVVNINPGIFMGGFGESREVARRIQELLNYNETGVDV